MPIFLGRTLTKPDLHFGTPGDPSGLAVVVLKHLDPIQGRAQFEIERAGGRPQPCVATLDTPLEFDGVRVELTQIGRQQCTVGLTLPEHIRVLRGELLRRPAA
ncbi:MAG: hypothetical protein H6981_07155 [Gammaproteobacteria bacterium]|nr:hypothetical protein [Gammaproteobacteria bacterium]